MLKLKKKKVAIIGLGFVGLPLALAVSSAKQRGRFLFDVIGIEQSNQDGLMKINSINEAKLFFKTEDKSLKKLLNYHVKVKKNFFATDNLDYIQKADVTIVTISCHLVNKFNYKKDYKKYIDDVLKIISKLKKNSTLIIESTLLPGTIKKYFEKFIQNKIKKSKYKKNSLNLVYSYERVMPGKNYINSITNNWRVVSGINNKSFTFGKYFYSKIINTKKYPIYRLTCEEAEVSKIIENSYRAVNIAFINEWQKLCKILNINLFNVIEAIKVRPTHNNIRYPGFGVGGYCLTKDPLYGKIALQLLNKKKIKFPISELSMSINKKMPLDTYEILKNKFKRKIKGKKILLMGYSYKEDVGDIRYSPSITLFEKISKENKITICDPYLEKKGIIVNSIQNYKIFDAIIFLVRHSVFKKISFGKKIRKKTIIIDSNNVLTLQQINDIKANSNEILFIGK